MKQTQEMTQDILGMVSRMKPETIQNYRRILLESDAIEIKEIYNNLKKQLGFFQQAEKNKDEFINKYLLRYRQAYQGVKEPSRKELQLLSNYRLSQLLVKMDQYLNLKKQALIKRKQRTQKLENKPKRSIEALIIAFPEIKYYRKIIQKLRYNNNTFGI